MSTSPLPITSRRARLCAVVLLALMLGGLGWMAASLPAQPPATKTPREEQEEPAPAKPKARPHVEEEEDTVKPKHKVVHVEEEEKGPKKPVNAAAPPETTDLLSAARQAKGPAVRAFLNSVAEPHDIVVNPRVVKRVVPVDNYLGNPPRFSDTITLWPFEDDEWVRAKKPWEVSSNMLTGIQYYEEIALKRVNEFLDPTNKSVPEPEKLRLAEMVLSSVLRYHESARQLGKRGGDEFDAMVAALRQKLLVDVQLKQLQLLADANDWDGAFAQALRLADAYPSLEDQQKIAQPLAQVIAQAAAADKASYNDDQLRELQRRLRQLEERFPTSTTITSINEKLKHHAEDLFQQAKDLVKKGQQQKALELLRQAEEIWPRLPELHDYRLQLDNTLAVLRVGVRDLPVYLSPDLACTDVERQAGELLFESLVKVSLDGDMGERYVPGLAEGVPSLIPLGRQFHLAHDVYWSNDKPVTAMDVRQTVRLLRDKDWSGRNPAWAELVDQVQVGSDPYRVNLTLQQGYIDPLSLMTFKILPEEPWPDQRLSAKTEERFAKEPVGSGPFQYQGHAKTDAGREYVSFKANPNYGSRAGKAGLPHIREIRFFKTEDPVKELKNQELDLVTDLPADKVKEMQGVRGVKVLPPLANLRIYFLAVNHRRSDLQNPDLRKAIAHAINRDKVLDDVFRAALGSAVHRALGGPFPPDSWACGPQQPYRAETARSHIKAAGLKEVKLSLKYPNDDPAVEKAMQAVRDQVQKEIGVGLELQVLPPRTLQEQLEVTHDYDLAYYHYDYPSEAYWLWPLFDPNATDAHGSNYLGYANDGELIQYLRAAMGHRDFQELQKAVHLLDGLLHERMPLIPLWQLDKHVAMTKDLQLTKDGQPIAFDPLLVFTDVDQWRLQKK